MWMNPLNEETPHVGRHTHTEWSVDKEKTTQKTNTYQQVFPALSLETHSSGSRKTYTHLFHICGQLITDVHSRSYNKFATFT